MLVDEVKKTDDALVAPSKPFVRNFEAETEEEKVHQANKKPHGFSLQK